MLLSALLVVFPLVGAAQLASLKLQSAGWADASTVLEGCGRALRAYAPLRLRLHLLPGLRLTLSLGAAVWLAQGLLLLWLLSDACEVQPSQPITAAGALLLLMLSVGEPRPNTSCRFKVLRLTLRRPTPATSFHLAAPFFSVVRSTLVIGSRALALGLDVAFLGCFVLLHKRQGPASTMALLGALAAVAGDALGLFGATQMSGLEGSVGETWYEVARAAAMCVWALSLATWLVGASPSSPRSASPPSALTVTHPCLSVTTATPALAHGRPSSRPHAGSFPAQQRRSVASSNDLGRHEAQYGRLSSSHHLPELPSPTGTGRLDISPSMTWSPEITTPRSVSGHGFDSRVSSHYAPVSVAKRSSPRVVQPADVDDDLAFVEIEMLAVSGSPTSAKPLERRRSFAPDKFSPPPRPISASRRSSPISHKFGDERRSSHMPVGVTAASPSKPASFSSSADPPSTAFRHRSLPHLWIEKRLAPSTSPLPSPLLALSTGDSDALDPFSRSTLGAAPVARRINPYESCMATPRPSPRDLLFPDDAQRAQGTTLPADEDVRSATTDVYLQRRAAFVLPTGADRTERASDQLEVDADPALEELRRPIDHSRWSTDSSVPQIDARAPHPFWSRKAKTATTPGIGHPSAPSANLAAASADQGSSAARSPLSRLGSLMGKVSHSRSGSRDTTADEPAPLEHPPFDSVALDGEARPATTREKRRPSRLNFGEVVSRLSSLAEAMSSASPSTAGRYPHRRGASDDVGHASVDKSEISLPIPIEGLSPLDAVRPSVLPPRHEPLEPAQVKQDLREMMAPHGHRLSALQSAPGGRTTSSADGSTTPYSIPTPEPAWVPVATPSHLRWG